MKFSIVIPTKNCTKVKKTIESVLNARGWKDKDCEVVVVANNCSDADFKDLKQNLSRAIQKGNVNLIYQEDCSSIAYARNFGIKRARGDYIIHVDDDCTLESDYLEVFRRNLREKNFAIARGKIDFLHDNRLLSKADCELRDLAYSHRTEVCYTPNLIVRADVYHEVGFLDERLPHGEDNEWSLRVKDSNFEPVYLEELKLRHIQTKSPLEIFKTYLYYGEARVYRYRKHKDVFWSEESDFRFIFRLLGEVPDLNPINSLSLKIEVMLLYLMRDFGVLLGTLNLKSKLQSDSVPSNIND